jgi:hypothetical protein
MQKPLGVLSSILLLCSCATHKSSPAKSASPDATDSKPIVTPDYRLTGTVAKVDADGRFVIISFLPGQMPKQNDQLHIYHNGLRVAEVKVDAKYQGDNNTVADIVTGEVQVGDEARQD